VVPIAESYRPDFVLVSAGYDAHIDDPLAGMEVTSNGFGGISQTLVTLAEKLCGGRVVFLLEGGYDLKGLKESALKSLDVLTGQRSQATPWKADVTFETVLQKSRKVLGSYWKF